MSRPGFPSFVPIGPVARLRLTAHLRPPARLDLKAWPVRHLRLPLFAILATLSAGQVPVVLAQGSHASPAQRPSSPPKDALTNQLELMLRAMRLARDWHVALPQKPQLVAGAVTGLLAGLDPEAEYYARSDLRSMARTLSTATGSVGLDVRVEPAARRQPRRGYRVVNARDGSPAARAGLKAGDLITHFDGAPAGETALLPVEQRLLSGPPGTSLRLTVERGPDLSPVDLHLDRTTLQRQATLVDEAAAGVAYLRPSTLDAPALAELTHAVESRKAAVARPLRGVVLDLRSVSGGSLETARAVADAFIDAGIISVTGARSRAVASTHQSTPGDIAKALPMVVLIDAGTAGPAELVAAALQENKRARLLGMTSAGRGALRTLQPLGVNGDKGAIRITTARLLTPSGQPLDGRGIKPDIEVEQSPPASACRSLDQPDPQTPGLCVRRSSADDGQLVRALSLLGAPHLAARSAAPGGKHP